MTRVGPQRHDKKNCEIKEILWTDTNKCMWVNQNVSGMYYFQIIQ